MAAVETTFPRGITALDRAATLSALPCRRSLVCSSAVVLAAVLWQFPAQAADSPQPAGEAVVIGVRRDDASPAPPSVGPREWFRAGLSDAAWQSEAAAAAVLLGSGKLSAEEKTGLSDALRRDRQRSGRAFAACLDPHQYDATTRLGAVHGIRIAEPAPSAAAKALACSALAEPVPQVRTAAIDLVRERKDVAVTAEIVRFWRAAYDEDVGFDEAKRVAAVAALRDIGDRRAFEALLYYATLEIYAGAATAATMAEASITGAGVNLPIQLPGMDLMSFHATIIVPAMPSLKGATGQDFGRDLAKWRDWVGKQPEYRSR